MEKLRRMGLYLVSKYHLFVMPLFILLLVEYLNRGALRPVASWGKHYFHEFVLNYLIVLGLVLFFIAMIGRTRYAFWMISSLLAVIALISGIKFRILGLPLLPWDIVLSSEAEDMAQYLKNLITLHTVLGLAGFTAAGWVLLHKAPLFRFRYSWTERGALALLSILLLVSLYSNKPIKLKTGIHTLPWDQAENYLRNGFLLTSMLNTDLVFIQQPPNYNEKTIQSIVSSIPRRTNIDKNVKPNVIVVLSEAFWDPTRIPGLKFSTDPIPFLHSLETKYPSGWMLSPQFGGGTANVEFEVLTGNTMRFMPEGSLPYIQYVNHGVDSLASILTRQGYAATAINPLDDWFFNSRSVYRYFGFNHYISSEFFRQVKKGPYLADSETMNNVIQATQQTPGPDMVFTNTMENHAFFYANKFDKRTVTVESSIPAASKSMLEVLATGLNDADKSLQQLVDYYSKSPEPTIILFFGDHLPFLGDNYQAYFDTKYIKANDPDFLTKMYETPFVIWNNFLPAKSEKLFMSPSYLGPYILNMAHMEGTYYTDFLSNLYKKYPVLPPENYYAAMHIDPNDKDLKNYELLQYDIMFGKRFGYKDIRGRIVDKNYYQGYGDIVIEHASPSEIKAGAPGDLLLTLSGQNLPELGKAFVNGTQAETKPLEPGTLQVHVPRKDLVKPGTLKIQVKLIDSKHVTIKKSNVYQVKIAK